MRDVQITDNSTTGGGLPIVGAVAALAAVFLVVHALSALVTALIWAVVALVVVAGLGLGVFIWWNLAHRTTPVLAPQPDDRPLRHARMQHAVTQQTAPAITATPEQHVHHHWHGVTPEDVAAVLRQEAQR